ncbi:hypothetical protein BsWGS_23852 [Bradybaena similaris]
MFHKIQLATFLFGGFVLQWLVADECPVKECYCGTVSILCESKGLTSLPPELATLKLNQTSLILDSNQITTIPARGLPANLTELSLQDNPIIIVEDTAFDASAFTLTTLSFSQARFTRIPDAFLHLQALTHLTIYETPITDWNLNAMKNIGTTLQQFYLTQNGLKTWPDCTQYFSQLTDLSVTSTSIDTIPDNALTNMASSLKNLYLLNNSLTAVPKALSNLTALEMLFLDQNKIVDITSLPTTSKLHTLVLDTNKISDANMVGSVLSRYAESFTTFSIENNKLTAMPNLAVLKKATEFYFTNNRISDPFSGSLPLNTYLVVFQNNILTAIPRNILNLESVTSLLLTSNIIRAIRADEIPQWVQLIYLDNNLITQITDSSFPVNSSLINLSLDFNPVSEISASAFQNVPLLSEISMQGSKLTRLPLALTSLSNLNSIDFSQSMNLVCTCVEKSFGPWLSRLEENDVIGNCGEISIYFFFVTLSPSCS